MEKTKTAKLKKEFALPKARCPAVIPNPNRHFFLSFTISHANIYSRIPQILSVCHPHSISTTKSSLISLSSLRLQHQFRSLVCSFEVFFVIVRNFELVCHNSVCVDMGDKEVLMYKDVVLRASDLDTLRGSCFLNDQIIAFYFSYLVSSSKTDDILLVRPSISICLANCQDDKFVEEFAQSCKLSSKRLVLFVVNDSDDFDGGDSGSHWSILVYDRTKNSFLHYDSMEGMNSFHAMKLYDTVKEYMGPGGEVSRPQASSSSSLKKQRNKKKKSVQPVSKHESVAAAVLPVFMECKTPQQSNGYDCGLYVLAIARAVCQWWCSHENNKSDDVLSVIDEHVDDSVEVKMRSEVLEIIQELTKD